MSKGMDTGTLIKYAAIAGGAYWAYTKIASDGGFDLTKLFSSGPTISTDIISAASLKAFVDYGRAQGTTDAFMQAHLDKVAQNYQACKAIGGATWNRETGSCVYPAGYSGAATPQVPIVPSPSGTTPAASAPPGAAAGPSLLEQLKAAAATDSFIQGQGGKASAHQWNYYRNLLRPPALSAEQFNSAFPGEASNTLTTPEEFLAKLSGAGLSGLGSTVFLPVPVRLNTQRGPTILWIRSRGAR